MNFPDRAEEHCWNWMCQEPDCHSILTISDDQKVIPRTEPVQAMTIDLFSDFWLQIQALSTNSTRYNSTISISLVRVASTLTPKRFSYLLPDILQSGRSVTVHTLFRPSLLARYIASSTRMNGISGSVSEGRTSVTPKLIVTGITFSW